MPTSASESEEKRRYMSYISILFSLNKRSALVNKCVGSDHRIVAPNANFNKEHSKIGLKYSVGLCEPITFGLGGVTSRNFSMWRAVRQAWYNGYNFLGGPPPPKIWGDGKRPKFGAMSDNFRLWSRISPERIEISERGKQVINYNSSHVRQQKFGELWSTNKNVIGAHVDPPKINSARAVYRLMQLRSRDNGVATSGILTPSIVSPVGLTAPAASRWVGSVPNF